MIQNHKFSTNA